MWGEVCWGRLSEKSPYLSRDQEWKGQGALPLDIVMSACDSWDWGSYCQEASSSQSRIEGWSWQSGMMGRTFPLYDLFVLAAALSQDLLLSGIIEFLYFLSHFSRDVYYLQPKLSQLKHSIEEISHPHILSESLLQKEEKWIQKEVMRYNNNDEHRNEWNLTQSIERNQCKTNVCEHLTIILSRIKKF